MDRKLFFVGHKYKHNIICYINYMEREKRNFEDVDDEEKIEMMQEIYSDNEDNVIKKRNFEDVDDEEKIGVMQEIYNYGDYEYKVIKNHNNSSLGNMHKNNFQYIDTRKLIYTPINKSGLVEFFLGEIFDWRYNYGYRNFKIITNINYVEKIELRLLKITGSLSRDDKVDLLIEESYNLMLHNDTPLLTLQENTLPALSLYTYYIRVKYNIPNDIEYNIPLGVEYDVFKINFSLVDIDIAPKILVKPIIYSDPVLINLKDSHHQINLNFNRLTLYLKVFLPISAKNVYLVIPDRILRTKLKLKNVTSETIQNKYTCWTLDFGKGINFGRIIHTDTISFIMFDIENTSDKENNFNIHIFSRGVHFLYLINHIYNDPQIVPWLKFDW